ncbi:hypothetical protein LOTGIDRAFT_178117 [Lottia gigantea]|uniref:SUMO-activating enzyme subunit n=1 Tax=Lottia gigantea TaxID=225164 RepID=V4ATI1_LOTGI|nr:hypothetical protein LOTGIDRAFT_178117 [Lottia gigantea]ESO98215.1 hypothetical protein LOTGIDRAFT_178117 [Lottia gigantea]
MKNSLSPNLYNNVSNCKVLVVGAGGIGCELLKNLVLTGFSDIQVIDLDTIDVSNLNRQFLFRKEHVGKSKSQVAKESALKFNPNVNIVAYHDSVMNPDYGADFFKQFKLVMNALDNRAARNHVNRMCLAADVPLVESGTAGYLGQVTVIKKGLTECYECRPKAAQKTFPGCTIRNTPSEPIHCVVWAKHLFNQLFGEEDPDQDVSPDTEDPELTAAAGESALEKETEGKEIERKSTRVWAMDTGYDAEKIFSKLFRDDIKYLLTMETLWKKRRPPEPLDYNNLSDESPSSTNDMRDQRIWSMKECADVFSKCLAKLKTDLAAQGDGGMLVWDKDDDKALDFVVSAANVRANIFGISQKSRFDIKSMAGNIIPAIATTNAIIAGLIVMEALKILDNKFDKCTAVYLNRKPNFRKKLLDAGRLDPPNPKCYVCSAKPEVTVVLNTQKITIKFLEDKILKSELGMVAPDVEIDNGLGTIIISSEEGETEQNNDKFLSKFNIINGSRLKCDDFLQNYNLNITIAHVEKLEDEKEFMVVGDMAELQAKLDENSKKKEGESSGATPGNTSSKGRIGSVNYHSNLYTKQILVIF